MRRAGAPHRAAYETSSGLGLIEPHGSGYYAADRGLFKKAGLDVELRQYQLGAIVAEAVAAGELQIGSSGVFSMLAGRQHGIPFVLIAPGPILRRFLRLTPITNVEPFTDINSRIASNFAIASSGKQRSRSSTQMTKRLISA